MVSSVDHVVNNFHSPRLLDSAAQLVQLYLLLVVGTIAALIVLAFADPPAAPSEAWTHAVIVLIFAVVLPLRLRRARAGSRGALRATGLIAAVLLLANVIEALIPGLFPTWMRIEAIGIAVLMAGIVLCVAIEAAHHRSASLAG